MEELRTRLQKYRDLQQKKHEKTWKQSKEYISIKKILIDCFGNREGKKN